MKIQIVQASEKNGVKLRVSEQVSPIRKAILREQAGDKDIAKKLGQRTHAIAGQLLSIDGVIAVRFDYYSAEVFLDPIFSKEEALDLILFEVCSCFRGEILIEDERGETYNVAPLPVWTPKPAPTLLAHNPA